MFYLDGDLDEKIGQIAHLDKNPSNSAEDNIAFLCLLHHTLRSPFNGLSGESCRRKCGPAYVAREQSKVHLMDFWSIVLTSIVGLRQLLSTGKIDAYKYASGMKDSYIERERLELPAKRG